MTKLILLKGHPIYEQPTEEIIIIDDDILDILWQMRLIISNSKINLIGLAANQIGYNKRIIILNYRDFEQILINPVIISEKGEQITQEGCASLDVDMGYELIRPQKITVNYFDEEGQGWKEEFEDMEAWIICHEIDHLNNIFIDDKAIKSFKRED